MEDRKTSQHRRETRRKQVMMERLILAGVILLLILITIVLITKVKKKNPAATNTNSTAAVTQETGGESEGIPLDSATGTLPNTAPETEDGSGAAGLKPMDERMLSITTQAGYVYDGQNGWVTPDLANIYYNGWYTTPEGATYHLDNSGLVDYGWKLIGGKGCYFDNNGVYQPDQDPNKLLAFTFDDGPSQGMDELLALCEETGARITFFMIGAQVENGGAVIPHIIQDRCELGNHSNTHTQMTKLSTEECVQNFKDCDTWIQSFSGGMESDVVRFPYGDSTPEEAAAVGKAAINWSVDSLDWELLEAQPVIDTVLSQITEGDIILMHDRYESTVEACRYLFPYLISQGYQLVTVKELAAAKGYTLEAGKTYYGFCQQYIDENRVYD